jgi:hypothetical protein
MPSHAALGLHRRTILFPASVLQAFSVYALALPPPGREQSGNDRRGQLGVCSSEQPHLGGGP